MKSVVSNKILIIEDNEQNLYLETYLLENSGYQVIAARDGPEAIQLAERVNADIILLDIQLPGMDGFAVLKAIKKIPRIADVPVIAVTSHAMTGDRERILAAGCVDYIEKPIDPEIFVAQIEKYLPTRTDHE
ncbi:MAG: response regulator [Proteobacteria bacterium]|nr:response regulator [Pseudomonadota bacterium]